MPNAKPLSLAILDDGRLERLDYDGLLRFHQGGAIWGATVAFRALQRAASFLSVPSLWDRRSLMATSAHPGPGVRDAFEYVTRCVSRGRYRLTHPQQEGQCHKDMKFAWWIDDGTRTVSVSLRDGLVPADFFVLVDRIETPTEQPGDQEQLEQLKAELMKQVLVESLDDLFHVTVSPHQVEKSGIICMN
jgi:hypothetical protein